jgi:hypothetical protein
MKKKNLKLNFSKETIAKLQQDNVKGGIYHTLELCNPKPQPLPETGRSNC